MTHLTLVNGGLFLLLRTAVMDARRPLLEKEDQKWPRLSG